MILLASIILVSAIVCGLLATRLGIALAYRFDILDKPGDAKIHSETTPRFGGFGIVVALLLVALATYIHQGILTWSNMVILLCISIVASVGTVDDYVTITPRMKTIGVLTSALIMTGFGNLSFAFLPMFGIGVLVALFYLVASSNAFNLLDGMDALAGSVGAIMALSLAMLFWTREDIIGLTLALSLCGGCMGFLWFNWHPARTFMGDIGSLTVGFTLGILALRLSQPWNVASVIGPILILYPMVLDTGLGIFRRWYHDQDLFTPDRGHIYDQLLQQGLSYSETLTVMLLFSTACCLAGILTTLQDSLIVATVAATLVLLGSIFFIQRRDFLAYSE